MFNGLPTKAWFRAVEKVAQDAVRSRIITIYGLLGKGPQIKNATFWLWSVTPLNKNSIDLNERKVLKSIINKSMINNDSHKLIFV